MRFVLYFLFYNHFLFNPCRSASSLEITSFSKAYILQFTCIFIISLFKICYLKKSKRVFQGKRLFLQTEVLLCEQFAYDDLCVNMRSG